METTNEILRKHFKTLHDLLDGVEEERKSWEDFEASLADLRTVVQQRQPEGSLAVNALRELEKARAAARAGNVERAHVALQNATVALKLWDTSA